MTEPAQDLATPEQRKATVARAINEMTGKGWKTTATTEYGASFTKVPWYRKTSINILISILTAGAWLIVWLFIAILTNDPTRSLFVNEFGTIEYS